jgi:HK97 family phage major capsid protein
VYTLSQAKELSNDVLLRGIIQTIVTESDVLTRVPFKDITGNSLTYNVETTMPGAAFYDVGDTWAESTGTHTQRTALLKILGGDADVDEFERETLSDQNDLEALTIEEKSKAVAYTFDDTFIYGDVSVNSKTFDGLHRLVASSMQFHQGAGATGAAMSLALLDQAIDAVKPGRPDAIIMNKTVRRRMKQFYRGTGAVAFEQEIGDDGKPIETYGGIPVLVNDFITQTETIASGAYTAKTGGATSSVFVVKFGHKEVCGLQHGGINKRRIGILETKDAVRWRIKWYCGLASFSDLALARIDGVTDAAVTT